MSEIAILLPVLGRPQRVEPLLQSISDSTVSSHRILFLCSPEDKAELAALEGAGADYLVVPWLADRADFAKKTNLGFRVTEEPFVFTGADDLVFERDWDIEALFMAEQSSASVIGTNDAVNPQVQKGHNATHLLMRRSYVSKYGSATFDNTGEVFCELYDHQFVDNETCLTAMLRGEWAFAPLAIVRHLHPHWGTAEMDATYEKALRATRIDRSLFSKRMRKIRVALSGYPRRAAV